MKRIIPLLILMSFMFLISVVGTVSVIPAGVQATFSLGFVILSAYMVGELTYLCGLPKLTGYILIGVISGPQVLKFIPLSAVRDLKLIDSIALSLIAFSAGREMKLELLNTYRRRIISITTAVIICQICGVGLLVWYLSGWWGPLKVASELRLPLALVFGLLAMAKSPLTTIAIIEETEVRNKFSYTILGIVVLKDIILIILFALLMGLLQYLTNPGALNNSELALALAWKLLGSLVIGIVLGWLISLYLRFINLEQGLFIVLVAFLASEFSHRAGLEPLLLCISAGMFIENFSPQGKSFLESLQKSSPMIYTVFFALAGAHLNLLVLSRLWPVALVLLIARASLSHLGINLGSRLVEDDPFFRKMGWQCMLNQAGVALALAMIIETKMPSVGRIATPVILGMITISDFIGPPLFKRTLLLSASQQD